MLSADDLKYFLAVAQTGRLVKAAEILEVDHTTVGRRINALERATGQRLFDRNPSGWQLTASGQGLLDPAEAVAAALRAANETVGNRHNTRLQGTVRILAPDSFGSFILAPHLGPLREENPDLTIELVTATAQLDHSVRSFDVAVTLGKPSSDRVFAKHLSPYLLRLFTSASYLARHEPIETIDDLKDHDLIWYVDKLLDINRLRDIPKRLPSPRIMVQSTNVIAHWQAAAAGVGIAPLPQFVASHDPGLCHILPEVEFSSSYWLVLPKEHARLPRVREAADLLEAVVEKEASAMHGPWNPPNSGGSD